MKQLLAATLSFLLVLPAVSVEAAAQQPRTRRGTGRSSPGAGRIRGTASAPLGGSVAGLGSAHRALP